LLYLNYLQNRAILNIVPSSQGALCTDRVEGNGLPNQASDESPPLALDLFPGSHIMFNRSTADANKSIEPPLSYPGATPDAERAKKPPLPEPPYKPYAKKPLLPGPPYEPYKDI
jgi:hypothetical protein